MPQADWSEAEQWAWDEIHAGKVVDFNERFAKKDKPDPRSCAGWDKDRLVPIGNLIRLAREAESRNASVL